MPGVVCGILIILRKKLRMVWPDIPRVLIGYPIYNFSQFRPAVCPDISKIYICMTKKLYYINSYSKRTKMLGREISLKHLTRNSECNFKILVKFSSLWVHLEIHVVFCVLNEGTNLRYTFFPRPLRKNRTWKDKFSILFQIWFPKIYLFSTKNHLFSTN